MTSFTPRERKQSVPGENYDFADESILLLLEGDRAKLAHVNISNIFWNLMEDAERRKTSHESQKRKPSLF